MLGHEQRDRSTDAAGKRPTPRIVPRACARSIRLTLRIVLDLQCCQTLAQSRGMGRYALALTKEIVHRGAEHDFFYLLNARLLPNSAPLLRELDRLPGRAVLFEGPFLGTDRSLRPTREMAANLLRNDRITSLAPDVYHVWSVFEGDAIFGDAVPWLTLPGGPVVNSVTHYDLIPAIFPDAYLRDPIARSAFNRTLAVAGRFDLGLAISQATKRDVERLMRIDPARVVNVSGDVDPYFRVLPADERRRGAIWSRLGANPFLLYVGGPDFRKNVFGIINAFAAIALTLPTRHDLVLVLSLDAETTRRLLARAEELAVADRVVVTGFIDDAELRELYNACALFLFPSIYEGLGMPVIEAMRCGAPVLVGDNSSLVEIVPDPDLRFDAGSSEAMASAMRRVLDDPPTLARMRTYSAERARAFSWAWSADTALRSWGEAVERSRRRPPTGRRPRLAMFTPLPNEKTGIADYSADFVPALSRHAEIELFVDDILSIDPDSVAVPIRHHSDFPACRGRFDAIVYQLGNSPYHHYMLPYMQRYPGVLVLHDAYVGHLGHDPGHSLPFVRTMVGEEGGAARTIVEAATDLFSAARALIDRFSCSASFVDRSIGAIVHSAFAKRVVRAVANPCAGAEIVVLQQYRAGVPSERRLDKATARDRLGLDPSVEIVATFGHVASTKGILQLIEAFLACNACRRGAVLVFVGELEGGPKAETPYAQEILAAIEGRTNICITGFVDQTAYDTWLRAIDVAVQLRTISRGETSGAMLNLLMNAKPFVFNRMGAAAEFPSAVALGIDDHRAETVRRALDRLLDDETTRAGYARAASAYTRDVLDADRIAERFVATVAGMADRARDCGPVPLTRAIAAVLTTEPAVKGLVDEIAAAFVRQERSEAPPRLLIALDGAATNIDTRVADVLRAAYRSPDRSVRAQAFSFAAGQAMLADDVASAHGWLLPIETKRQGPLSLRPFDRVLLIEDALGVGSSLRPFASELRALGGTLTALIDDFGPVDRPTRYPSALADKARTTFDILLEHDADLICRSRHVASRLSSYIAARKEPIVPSSRIAVLRSAECISADLANGKIHNRSTETSIFLLDTPIRTEEGHDFVLKAFEQHWREDGRAELIVITGLGWDLCETIENYARHTESGRRLHIYEASKRADLHARAITVIIAADTEASIEAADKAVDRGSRVLCADLEALRSVVDNDLVRFFEACNVDALNRSINSIVSSSHSTVVAQDSRNQVSLIDLARGFGWEKASI